MLRRIIPIFFFAPAINALKEGRVGEGIAILGISAVFILVNAFFDDEAERKRQKR